MEMDDKRKRQSMMLYILIGMVVFAMLHTFVFPNMMQQVVTDKSYSEFIADVDAGKVEKVDLDRDTTEITYTMKNDKPGHVYKTTMFPNDDGLVERLQKAGVNFSAHVPDETGALFIYLLINLLPLAILIGGGMLLNRQLRKQMGEDNNMSFGGGFGLGGGLGRSGAKEVKGEETGKNFGDVAGQDEAKESLQEIVGFLKDPERYAEIGAKLPHGALLVGPPGTGKTLLAQAVAGEANVPFFSISGSEFVEMFVGRGAAKVRDLFKQANEKAPCIVFIDEIDAVGKRRDSGLTTNDEREQTLNQLLAEMDGFDNHKGIVVFAATNRPESLDPALTRPGRFDRRIPVELPDLAGREAILKLHAGDVKMEAGVDFGVIARQTPGASGADLANMINEAALRAVRMGRTRVTQDDILESVDVVIAGEKKKSTVLSEREREMVSYHECGHAIVAAVQDGKAPVSKITIVPRTSGALGFTMQTEEDERYLTTREEYKQKIAVLCGGRAAEELIFNQMTSGAANDIERATGIARAMVTQLGMSDRFGMMSLGKVHNQYLGGDAALNCSEGTAQEIDAEVQRLVEEGHQTALETLRQNRFKLHEIAHYLQKKETITGDEFMRLLMREDGFAPKIPDTEQSEKEAE